MAKSKPGSAVFGAVILLVLVRSCVVLFRPVKQTPAEVAADKLEMAMIRWGIIHFTPSQETAGLCREIRG